ncbi:transglutaminase domain-containing protein [Flavobacterium restrictum]|uniref:Transglutaminase-like domain-containing protein n=1 Tax=Flavobacterium restrictum TaxID=2594428 RepID=A0A553E1P1_9FLAO|nr:transglutaminase domain-containing protein [Flavobacterium restrictum]TRX38974.1 hypothetical protein FNW21_10300 [Flavobacterium restrictum]
MKKIVFFLSFLCSLLGNGQTQSIYSKIDSKMAVMPKSYATTTTGIASYINANFNTESDKVRAAFFWTATTISYDIANINTIDYNTTSEQKINATLSSHKGVCIHYAEVFNSIANQVGVKSYVVHGYTKQFGAIATVAHAWCSVKIDSKWWLMDPTWGAGYVDKQKYFRKLNAIYFKMTPSAAIATHMPFDYLWQFLSFPISNQEFISGKLEANTTKKKFDFESEILKQENALAADKIFDATVRIEKNGIKNNLIQDYWIYKKKELENIRQNETNAKFSILVTESNQAILLYNDFIGYRNKQFKPTLPDDVLLKMIQEPKEQLLKCQNQLDYLEPVNEENRTNVTAVRQNVASVLEQVKDQEKFVLDYLSKGKGARKAMFTKMKWFGIPLN